MINRARKVQAPVMPLAAAVCRNISSGIVAFVTLGGVKVELSVVVVKKVVVVTPCDAELDPSL